MIQHHIEACCKVCTLVFARRLVICLTYGSLVVRLMSVSDLQVPELKEILLIGNFQPNEQLSQFVSAQSKLHNKIIRYVPGISGMTHVPFLSTREVRSNMKSGGVQLPPRIRGSRYGGLHLPLPGPDTVRQPEHHYLNEWRCLR